MTHQEMMDQVSDEIRDTTVASKITRWLNMGTDDTAFQYTFGSLVTRASVSTIASNPDVTLADDLHWLKTIGIPVTSTKVRFEDESILAESDPKYRITTGSIINYYLNGNILGLYRVPTGVTAIPYSYQRYPAPMVDPTDVCELPRPWHTLVCQKAITRGYKYQGNEVQATASKDDEKELLVKLGAAQYRRPDAVTIIGSAERSGRPARPKLPPHFPAPRY